MIAISIMSEVVNILLITELFIITLLFFYFYFSSIVYQGDSNRNPYIVTSILLHAFVGHDIEHETVGIVHAAAADGCEVADALVHIVVDDSLV